jgi:hypothetical protein
MTDTIKHIDKRWRYTFQSTVPRWEEFHTHQGRQSVYATIYRSRLEISSPARGWGLPDMRERDGCRQCGRRRIRLCSKFGRRGDR